MSRKPYPFVVERETLHRWIEADSDLMAILLVLQSTTSDAWVCGGYFRRLADANISNNPSVVTDIDIAVVSDNGLSRTEEDLLRDHLRIRTGTTNVSVKSSGRMIVKNDECVDNDIISYVSSFPEVSSCIGARLDKNGIAIVAPYGLQDLLKMQIRPSEVSLNMHGLTVFERRRRLKRWSDRFSVTYPHVQARCTRPL